MSFKLPSIASFFSRASHKVEDDKKSSSSQFVTVTPHKIEKTDSKESDSKISRFFHRLFHSKEKAREGVEAALKTSNAPYPVSLHVESESNKYASPSMYVISFNTAAQNYLKKLDEISIVSANPADFKTKIDQRLSDTSISDLHKSNIKDDETMSNSPEDFYAELDQRREFIDSNPGRFMLDITNMGSCIDKPQQHFLSSPGLDLQKTLAHAFQIYYEEGQPIDEDSFATPSWGHEATTKSPEDLESLKANLKKINTRGTDARALLQKAVGAIEVRISRLNEERQKGRNPS
ncbi:hypothetical protein MCEGEM3_02198 [Oxalobacteraceae bacterium]